MKTFFKNIGWDIDISCKCASLESCVKPFWCTYTLYITLFNHVIVSFSTIKGCYKEKKWFVRIKLFTKEIYRNYLFCGEKVKISDEKEEEKESDARAIESALPKNHSE